MPRLFGEPERVEHVIQWPGDGHATTCPGCWRETAIAMRREKLEYDAMVDLAYTEAGLKPVR
ncbi:MAG: hypothetical protein OXS29_03430 [bacterium]|nr:hypothetical protein [bacterium]MDE0288203.1 hypothetical protein [bacterium]MDE0437430.1 hypothetical protein [bacterium]